MKLKNFAPFLIGLALILTSCSGNNNEEILKLTNEKTLGIVKFNIDDVIKKLPKEEILADTVKKFSNADKEFRLFVRADELGINTENPFYITTESEKDKLITSCVFWLDDEVLFLKKFKEIYSKELTIDYDKNLVFSNKEVIGAFKDGMFVLSNKSYDPYTSRTKQYQYYDEDYVEEDMTVSKEFYTNFFTRKPLEDENIIDNIDKALTDDADASVWVNLHGIVSTATKGYIETLAINKLLIGSGFGFNLTFGEGKIECNGESFFNEDMKKIVEKYYQDKGINYDLVKSINIDNSKSFALGYFSLDFMKYFIKEAGFESTINNFLAYRDITIDDFVNGFTGDYAFITNGTIKKEINNEYLGYTQEIEMPSYALIFGKKGDKAKKIIDMLHNEESLMDHVVFAEKDKLVVSNDTLTFDYYKSKKTPENKKLDKKSGVTSISWSSGADFNKSLGNTNGMKAKIVSVTSESKMKDGNSTGQFVITLDKKDKNAICYLIGYE